MTYDQVAARKDKAERFVRNVLGDDDRADEIADESVESYADRKHYPISNPRRLTTMANASQSKQDLLDQIDQLEQENQDLQDALSAIADIVAPSDTDDDDDADYDDDGSDVSD
jgi:hypothetical protein